MKKINIILIGGAISTLMLTQSCQQPQADQATVDAKVTELYNAEKLKVENEAATACEDAINAQVKILQDSLSHLSAKAQADLLAKTQRELKAAQLKADALKKKALADKKKTQIATKKVEPKPKTNPSMEDAFKEAQKNGNKSMEDAFKEAAKEQKKGGTSMEDAFKKAAEEQSKNK